MPACTFHEKCEKNSLRRPSAEEQTSRVLVRCLDCLEQIEFSGEQLISSVLSKDFPRSARCLPCYRKWRIEQSMVDAGERDRLAWAVARLKFGKEPPDFIHRALLMGPYGAQWEAILRAWQIRRTLPVEKDEKW